MINLDVLTTLLTNAGVTTVYQHYMPPEIKSGVLLRQPLEGVDHDHYLPGYFRAKVQAIVREQTHAAGETIANLVERTLTIKQRTTYKNESDEVVMVVNHLLPKTRPIRYPRSDGNGIEWSINFEYSMVDPAFSQY